MGKKYILVENYDHDDFVSLINSNGELGYVLVSHTLTFDNNNNTCYSAVMVKYYNGTDYIENIMDKLDNIDANISN